MIRMVRFTFRPTPVCFPANRRNFPYRTDRYCDLVLPSKTTHCTDTGIRRGRLQVFAVEVSGHVHFLFGNDAIDLSVKPWLLEVKPSGNFRHELLALRAERVVKH